MLIHYSECSLILSIIYYTTLILFGLPYKKISKITNDRLGGRIYTYYENVDGIEYRMDLGTGRLGFAHKLILSLLDDTLLEIKNLII
tara:strand:- start:31 stop:291 length:261 start_codon:yes stop_codon:yes gene_type:complete